MEKASHTSNTTLRGIAALFDDGERKDLFRKYLIFLGCLEILIFLMCWLYQLGDQGYDRFGPIEIPFPWKVYFLVSFLAPVAITFLIGVVIIGFNKYFAEPDFPGDVTASMDGDIFGGDKTGRTYKLHKMVVLLQRLPFLGLLLLLGVAVGVFYNLDVILAFIGNVGEKSFKVVLLAAGVLLAVAAVFALILIVLNFKLRKKSMEYQYRSKVADRFGIIILEDNTVLNSEGKLLIHGKKWQDVVPMLPAGKGEQSPRPELPSGTLAQTVDLKSS